jgi:ribosome maturation factor RimP
VPTLYFCGDGAQREAPREGIAVTPDEQGEEEMAMSDDLCDVLSPLLKGEGLELVDLEVRAGLVRVTVDRPGGVDLEALSAANRVVSAALDDVDPVPGRYTLEVSSPGVERRLRTPEQFSRAVGETVSVRTLPGDGPARRLRGRLSSVDGTGFVVEDPDGPVRTAFDEVERARTVFEWGTPSRAGGRPGHRRSPRSENGNARTGRITTK